MVLACSNSWEMKTSYVLQDCYDLSKTLPYILDPPLYFPPMCKDTYYPFLGFKNNKSCYNSQKLIRGLIFLDCLFQVDAVLLSLFLSHSGNTYNTLIYYNTVTTYAAMQYKILLKCIAKLKIMQFSVKICKTKC